MRAVLLHADWDPRPGYRPTPGEVATGKATTASLVWRHPRYVGADVPDPTPARDEVVLKVRACGICGSDTHCYEQDADGYLLFSGPLRAPCIGGHEYTAEVAEVGADVRTVRRGDLVVAEGMLYCGVCEACRRGRPNQCTDLDMVGFSAPGAFATWIAAKERSLWSLEPLAHALGDADRALELGALVEPIGVSYNGMFVATGGFAPGAHVAVFGCGAIGLGAIALARAAGAATIVAFEPIAARRRIAVKVGADEALDPAAGHAADAILATTRGWGADMVVEAAGAALETMPEIERAFAPGAKLVYLGRTGLSAPVRLDALVAQAAHISGARGHAGGGCFPSILRLLERGRLNVEPLITRRFPFADATAALQQSCDRGDGKILLRYA
jgi:threonine dehydrogenase-like Zn-dependent dehydrogenase